jgi:hypothetical protein
MVYINPTAITSSGNNQYFTNKKGTIHKFVINLIDNGDILNNFMVQEFNEQYKNKNTNVKPSQYLNDNDFRIILQNQRNNSKLNKLNKFIN